MRKELKPLKAELMDIRGLSTYVECHGNKQSQAVVLLHGFTGSANTWIEITQQLSADYYVIAVDLVGHGRTASPEDPSRCRIEEQTADLHNLLRKLQVTKPVLLGYSMGGRVAAGYAYAYSEEISGLILESSSPGLRTAEERTARRESDAILANRIENEGIEKFVEYWEAIPLFDSQKKLSQEQQLAVRNERLNQDSGGLANSLRGMGTGSQPSYWGDLSYFNFPVLLLTGSEDAKFQNIAREMSRLLPNVLHETIIDAGHALHVEKPRQFATMVKSFLKQFDK